MTNILILAAGRGKVETTSEIVYPACITELNGVSVLEKIICNLNGIPEPKYTFAFHAQDMSKYHLDNIASLLVHDARVAVVPENTMGSACTALLAASELDPEQPLLIISANELVDDELHNIIRTFSDRGLDAGTLVFRSIHPRYSYVRLNEEGLITEAAQHKPISKIATTGVFWFSRSADFIEAAKNTIRKNASSNGGFYIAPVFNELILKHKKIGVHEIDKTSYIPLKTIRQIQQYEEGQ